MEPNLPLRDVHLPEPIGWWPLAPGWWLLLIGIPTLLIFLVWLWRFVRRTTLKKLALAELERIVQSTADARAKVQQLAILMRRVSISVYRREEVASLVGEQWLRFLDGLTGGKPFSEGVGRLFIEAPYRREVQADLDALFTLCRQCIKQLPRSGKATKKTARNQQVTIPSTDSIAKVNTWVEPPNPNAHPSSDRDYSRFSKPIPREDIQP